MSERNPVIERYLGRFREPLKKQVPGPELDEMAREFENHIAEAEHSGQPLATVLEKLGPADRLADAYRVELLLKDRSKGISQLTRLFAVIGIVAASSLPTIILVPLLGGLGFGFTVGGSAAILAAIVSPFLPASMVSSNLDFPLPQLGAFGVGLVLLPLGLASLALLYLYLRFLIRAIRDVIADVKVSV